MKLNFIEALAEVANAQKIKGSDWDDGSYIFLKGNGSVWVRWALSNTEEMFGLPVDILAPSWEVIQEPHDVLWAVAQMKAGSRVARSQWKKDCWIRIDKNSYKEQNFIGCEEEKFVFSVEDIEARDWHVY